jgi:hypothetical protein
MARAQLSSRPKKKHECCLIKVLLVRAKGRRRIIDEEDFPLDAH